MTFNIPIEKHIFEKHLEFHSQTKISPAISKRTNRFKGFTLLPYRKNRKK